ncbi:MAG: hypothetical protein AAB502_10750, partial [Chloroflexota bacterium]
MADRNLVLALLAAILMGVGGAPCAYAQGVEAGAAQALENLERNIESQMGVVSEELNQGYQDIGELKSLLDQAGEAAKQGRGADNNTIVIEIKKKRPPEGPAPESETVRVTPVQLGQARQAAEAAASSYGVIRQKYDLARQAIQKAQAAQDPSVRRVYLNEAGDHIGATRYWRQNMGRALGTWKEPDAPKPRVIQNLDPKLGPTFRFLQKMAGQEAPNRYGGVRLELFDNPKAPLAPPPAPASPAPRGTPMFGIGGEKPPVQSRQDPNVLETDGGGRIDIRSIRDAVGKVDPSSRGKPLFVPCTQDGRVCPSETLYKHVATPDRRAELSKVGGVALDVTFDMLKTSGIADFRQGIQIRLVDAPYLVSLKKLHAAVKPFAERNQWDRLPDHLRHPGGLQRVHGFVLDPQDQDIHLVGTPAREKHLRLDIDSLILALRVTWRDGRLMGVSLDPKPDDRGGPQYSRHINVPADSVPAKIMLDADYAMKAIIFGTGFNKDQSLLPVSKLLGAAPDQPMSARFWLNPVRLTHDALQVSQTRRTVLFESQVQALTETVFLSEQGIAGAGKASDVHSQIALALSRRYSDYE